MRCQGVFSANYCLACLSVSDLFLQHDPWGKQGKESLAGQLWAKTAGTTGLSDNETYSEVCIPSKQFLAVTWLTRR